MDMTIPTNRTRHVLAFSTAPTKRLATYKLKNPRGLHPSSPSLSLFHSLEFSQENSTPLLHTPDQIPLRSFKDQYQHLYYHCRKARNGDLKFRFWFLLGSNLMGICFSYQEELSSINYLPGHAPATSPTKEKESTASPSGRTATSIPIVPKNLKDLRQNPGCSNVDVFTYAEMRMATKLFRPDQILGEGGFGIVYKGVIDEVVKPGYKTTQVAIKELNPEGFQGDREWLAEVNYLGQLSHPNLVKLIGFCCEDEHRLLVYEYMACGSLEKHLFRRVCATLTWSTRMKIALDAAKGLAFLHGAERSIIYRDFKTSNILLDSNYRAKLSDFGLAKDGPMGDQTHVSTRVMGTYGYAAPEYVMTGHLTARSDVYGFGVVLLELLIGRRAMDKSRPSREHNLVEWARPLLNHNKKLLRILDPRMEGQYSTKMALKVANLAYQCLSQNPKGRPVMSQVVEILETVATQSENQEEAMLQSGGSCGFTLYEAKGAYEASETKPKPINLDGERDEAHRQRKAAGRSKSEPPKEGDLFVDSESDEKSASPRS